MGDRVQTYGRSLARCALYRRVGSFNEAWGQHATVEVGKMAAALDSTRLINIASGGNFWPVGDIADHHSIRILRFR